MIELISALAIWKITATLIDYDGPMHIIKNTMDFIHRYDRIDLFNVNCFFCFSTIISIPFAVYLVDGWDIIIYWFGLAGAAMIINTIYERFED